MNKVNATCPTTSATTVNWDNKAHSIGVSGGSGGTVQYSTDNSSWGTTIQQEQQQGLKQHM
jgi:hypothetical protein